MTLAYLTTVKKVVVVVLGELLAGREARNVMLVYRRDQELLSVLLIFRVKVALNGARCLLNAAHVAKMLLSQVVFLHL